LEESCKQEIDDEEESSDDDDERLVDVDEAIEENESLKMHQNSLGTLDDPSHG
jgi:hypothetical protein